MTDTSASLSRRHRYWIALAIAASLVGAGLAVWFVGEPTYRTVTMMFGRPQLADCKNAIMREERAGEDTFRITVHDCAANTLYFVFLYKKGSVWAAPLALVTGSPVPNGVIKIDESRYEIAFATPLADGTHRLPLTVDSEGYPAALRLVDAGTVTIDKDD